jgi:glycosyltransferase involved in cell wall biosynthesis
MPAIPPTKSADPLVSVIIPTYNRAGLLPRALASARNQTYPNIEILVVDDASTDNTRDLVAAIPDPRVRYFRHERNRGGGAARNTGFEQARGDYIALLDSDDEWMPAKLQAQIPAMVRSDAQLGYCQAIHMDPAGSRIYPQQPYAGGNLLRFLMTEPNRGLAVPSLVVHRTLVVPFDEALPVHHDLEWILRIFPPLERVCFIPTPLLRVHLDAPFRIRDSRTVPLIDKVKPFLEKCARDLEIEACYKRQLIWSCALDALAGNDKRLARSILWTYRVFPSLHRKPRAWNAWRRCVIG